MSFNKNKNQQPLRNQIDDIEKQHDTLRKQISQQTIRKTLLEKIDKWEKDSIKQIQSTAAKARVDLQGLLEQPDLLLRNLISDLNSKRRPNNCTQNDIERWNKLLDDCRKSCKELAGVNLGRDPSSPLDMVKIQKSDIVAKETDVRLPPIPDPSGIKSRENARFIVSSPNDHSITRQSDLSDDKAIVSPVQPYPYPSITVGINQSTDVYILNLFQHLRNLRPMDKNGSMSGNCDAETYQMEKFLSKTFDFRNIDGQYIVGGVRAFRLGKPLISMHKDTVIYFPDKNSNSYAMNVQEITDWQLSYAAYGDKNVKGITKEFLQQALQGLSTDGEEAFRMKFVVRISTCPILMEFDARVISRVSGEEWPHKIKLVSVTGVDFAGRKHDIGDIMTYVLNWTDVFETDRKTGSLLVFNGRDFCPKRGAPEVQLDERRLLNDLICMARLRLRACDTEGVEIVVETGIGLGVFAGKHIGIDGKVRALSALAIRTVLEQDGPSYKTIRGIVFALPIFDDGQRKGRIEDTYQAFVDEFEREKYNGRVPVLITDQDMHRLTVAIARHGLTVSELNPADSHGVFGEYWQNRGPAVEEKLALTTVGLLVQHHLINPQVLDPKKLLSHITNDK